MIMTIPRLQGGVLKKIIYFLKASRNFEFRGRRLDFFQKGLRVFYIKRFFFLGFYIQPIFIV
jgi:hypothetical protein